MKPSRSNVPGRSAGRPDRRSPSKTVDGTAPAASWSGGSSGRTCRIASAAPPSRVGHRVRRETQSRSRPRSGSGRHGLADAVSRPARTTGPAHSAGTRSTARAKSPRLGAIRRPGSSRSRPPSRPPSAICRSVAAAHRHAPVVGETSADGRGPECRRTFGCPLPRTQPPRSPSSGFGSDSSAWCADRPGRKPYEQSRKSCS